jgi:CubicO group peptidase (beta-lactamase class C family)
MARDVTRREWLRLGTAGAGLLAANRAWPVPPERGSRPDRPSAADELQAMLDELVAKYRMPGAIAAVSRRGEVLTAATGIANLNTGARMTPDLAFIAGSITKVWTTTLAMTFVDDKTVELDVPLVHYLRHLRFGDPAATRMITLRHLLNHSSGLDVGDYFLDRGEGPCAHQIYIDALAHIEQIHRPGRYSSYCNGGFMIVAHLLERLSGKSWRQLLVERVIRPMGLGRTYVDAEDGVLHGMVVGSLPDPSQSKGHVAVPKLLLPRTMAPVGTTLIFNVTDLLAFGRMHRALGVADNGTRILSEQSARAMATRTIDAPTSAVAGFGLGWMHAVVDGRTVLSHGGGSNGGRSLVMVVPELDLVLGSFVNSSAPGELQTELHDALAARYGQPGARTSVAEPIPSASGPIDRSRFLGTFRRKTTRTTIREEGGKLLLDTEWILAEAEGTEAYGGGGVSTTEVVPLTASALGRAGTTALSRSSGWMFLEPDERGRFRLVYQGGRLSKRIA